MKKVNKIHQSKPIPKPTSKRQSSSKHKRQTTMFKFHNDDNSKDREKLLLKTNSSISISFNSIRKENINQTNFSNKIVSESINAQLKENDQKDKISKIDFQKAKQKYSWQNI